MIALGSRWNVESLKKVLHQTTDAVDNSIDFCVGDIIGRGDDNVISFFTVHSAEPRVDVDLVWWCETCVNLSTVLGKTG
jgi:hypothetical protein